MNFKYFQYEIYDEIKKDKTIDKEIKDKTTEKDKTAGKNKKEKLIQCCIII